MNIKKLIIFKFCFYCVVKFKIFSNSIYIVFKLVIVLLEFFNNIFYCFDLVISLKNENSRGLVNEINIIKFK